MSRGVNKVILIGNAGKDPELKYFPNGDAFCNMSLATSETWMDKVSGDRKERTEWHSLVFTRRLAEIVGQYVRKGARLYIEGSLRSRKWKDREGIERYITEIMVGDMQMLTDGRGDDRNDPGPSSRPSARPAPSQPPRQSRESAAQAAASVDFEDDDIPF